jgi:hypothetical protein
MKRTTAHWVAITLLVGLSVLGLQSAIDELGSASTLGQQAATATQFGYALAGLLAAAGLLGRRAWSWATLWVWAGLITLTCGMAPVVWGGAGLLPGLAAAVAGGGVAAFGLWLAKRDLDPRRDTMNIPSS